MTAIKRLKAFGLGAILAVTSAVGASATVYYDQNVHHSSQVGSAASVLAAGLSTSASSFNGSSSSSRAAAIGALTSSDVLFLGQNEATTTSRTAAEDAAIKTFVEGGGTLIKLWGSNLSLLNSIAGESFTYSYSGIVSSTKTANAAGTSFDSVVGTLPALNDHGGILLSSLGGAISMYENGLRSHVAVKSVGAGHVAFLSWDWCCGQTPTTLGQWNAALLAAATYDGGMAPVPLPAGLPLLAVGLFSLGFLRRRGRA